MNNIDILIDDVLNVILHNIYDIDTLISFYLSCKKINFLIDRYYKNIYNCIYTIFLGCINNVENIDNTTINIDYRKKHKIDYIYFLNYSFIFRIFNENIYDINKEREKQREYINFDNFSNIPINKVYLPIRFFITYFNKKMYNKGENVRLLLDLNEVYGWRRRKILNDNKEIKNIRNNINFFSKYRFCKSKYIQIGLYSIWNQNTIIDKKEPFATINIEKKEPYTFVYTNNSSRILDNIWEVFNMNNEELDSIISNILIRKGYNQYKLEKNNGE